MSQPREKLQIRFFPTSELRVTGKKKPKITGYAAVFNSLSEDMGYKEIIRPGAFTESLKNGDEVKSFWNHNSDMVLGSTKAGTLELEEDSKGLRVTIFPPDTQWAKDGLESIRRGDTSSMSFGFHVESEEWTDGIRELHQVRLLEVSPISGFAAYKDTSVSIRSKEAPNMNAKELYEERNRIIKQQRELLDKNKGELGSEDTQTYQNLEQRFDELTSEIEKQERVSKLEDREKMLSESRDRPLFQSEDRKSEGEHRATSDYDKAFRAHLCLRSLGPSEQRALRVSVDTEGGYVVASEQFVGDIQATKKDRLVIRQYATVIPVPNAVSLGFPYLETEPAQSTWGTEIWSGDEETSTALSKRALYPHPAAIRLKVSEPMVRMAPNAVNFIVDRMAYRSAVLEEEAFLSGSGVNQPSGIFNDTDILETSTCDISDANTTTSIKADNLINVLYSMKPQYVGNSRWLFHRDAVKMIRKLKSGEGDYLWRSGIASDRPDTILDRPYEMLETVPAVFETGLYVGALADLSYYWIADALDMRIKVADQLYLETNQIGYFLRFETDGMPVEKEAFRRVTLA